MPAYELTVQLRKDGRVVAGFPISRRLEVTKGQSFDYTLADSSGFVSIPKSQITSAQVVVLTADQDLTLRLGTGAAGDGSLQNASVVVLFDISEADIELDNSSGATARVFGEVGGA